MQDKSLKIEKLTLVPSGGGRFEVTADGRQIWSKAETRRFPEFQEVLESLSQDSPA